MTMREKVFALFILSTGLFASTAPAQDDLIGRVLDDRVHFQTPAEWLMAERPRGFGFLISNAGGGLHSNLPALSIYDRDLRTVQESNNFQEEATRNVRNFQPRELAGGWDCRTWALGPSARKMVTWDCRNITGNFGVAVDLMWLHLARQPPDYDVRMEQVLSDFLGNVSIR